MFKPIITSILDTDNYKFTMQQAVLRGKMACVAYESVNVAYEFINRGKTPFPPYFADKLREQVEAMSILSLSQDEKDFLRHRCKYLKRSYLDWLSGYRFDPNEVSIRQNGGDLFVRIEGPWARSMGWEVPLLAIISELYYIETNKEHDSQYIDRAVAKSVKLDQAGVKFGDFGTRRRFSKEVQQKVVESCMWSPHFTGTSNVGFSKRYNFNPIGTHAHEFFQFHAAMFGYRLANQYAMESWVNEFDGDLGYALTDTFGLTNFLQCFSMKYAKLFDGVRQDSGDEIEFAKRIIHHYKSLKIDPSSKSIIFSNGLTVDKAIEINEWCKKHGCGIKVAFGIGTFLTNDCGHSPLNIVIKMVQCDGMPVIKLSDDIGKESGDAKTIDAVRYLLRI